MAVGPKEVDRIVNTDRYKLEVDRLVVEIDKRLRDYRFLKNEVCDEESNPNWTVSEQGTLNVFEREYMRKLYLEAGWGDVYVRSLEEEGDQPGVWLITLYKNKGGSNV